MRGNIPFAIQDLKDIGYCGYCRVAGSALQPFCCMNDLRLKKKKEAATKGQFMNYLKAFHLLKARRSDVMGKQGLAYLNAFGGINKIFTVCENLFSERNLQVNIGLLFVFDICVRICCRKVVKFGWLMSKVARHLHTCTAHK